MFKFFCVGVFFWEAFEVGFFALVFTPLVGCFRVVLARAFMAFFPSSFLSLGSAVLLRTGLGVIVRVNWGSCDLADHENGNGSENRLWKSVNLQT